jgi:hypothetical protein
VAGGGGQIFFTLSVGMGTLQTYASYLSTKDDIALSGIATAATNETVEVVLGGSIAIPAAVAFFGVAGAMEVAQSGSFNLGFVACPSSSSRCRSGRCSGRCGSGSSSSRDHLVGGHGHAHRGLLPRGVRLQARDGGVGRGRRGAGVRLLTILWFEHGVLWDWDFWAGDFGLVVMATIEIILFMWIFKPENAWASIHQGADIRIPSIYKFVMTFVTPLYLLVILTWWGIERAIPTLMLEGATPGSETYLNMSRLILLGIVVFFWWRSAWRGSATATTTAWASPRWKTRIWGPPPERRPSDERRRTDLHAGELDLRARPHPLVVRADPERKKHFDPDGTGPASPPERGAAEDRAPRR